MVTMTFAGHPGARRSRRSVYRQGKRLLARLLARTWRGPRKALEPAVRRYLAGRTRGYLLRLVGDRAFALAAAAALLAAGTAGALPPVNLSDVAAGTGGFVINGIDPGDQSGISVSGAGDVNGDGLTDLVVGAWRADPAGNSNAGESYVVFGKADGTAVDLSDVAAGTGGFVINGIDTGDFSGASVSGAGDVNGDGLDDLVVGAFRADPAGNSYAGESYLVFGKADGTAVDLSAVAGGTGGFVINGIDPSDYSGVSVWGAGDVNGDGLDDCIVGARSADPAGNSSAGESYMVFGKADGTAVNLSDVAAGTSGFVINGIDPSDVSGFSVSGAGDVNNDGLDDLIVGAFGADPAGNSSAGESYVVFGKAAGVPVNLSVIAAGTGGFVINGIDASDFSGFSVSGAGDVNGDGLDDVIVGAHRADPAGNADAGESYVVFNPACPWDCNASHDGNVNVADLLALLGQYDPLAPDVCDGGSCDYDGNGCVDVVDLLKMLGHYTTDPLGIGCP